MTPSSAGSGTTDAVAQLLGTVWDDALDPGYASAAAARAQRDADGKRPAAQPSAARRTGAVAGAVALGLVGLLLAMSVVQAHLAQPAAAQRRTDLLARVRGQTDRYDAMTADVARLQAQLSRLKAGALAATTEGEHLTARVNALELVSGQRAVTGPGVQVTLDDAIDPPPGTDPALDHVLDRDLQNVVNGLWLAGAEAVSVGGQRLTATSAIRAAGDAILVDYRPLQRPYVVSAIGDPTTLESRFSGGPSGRALRTLRSTYGIVYSVESVDHLALPAAPASGLRYARPEGAGK